MQFLDKTTIKIISGRGGNGVVAWRREKYVEKGGPAGGDGGRGGDVFLVATEDMSTLLDFRYQSVFKAENGENGFKKNMHGKWAKPLYIKVPVGTIVRDLKSGKIIGDLTYNGQELLVAKGGRGGRGNARFATPQKRAPQFCEPGEPGITRELELELKLIADVGLLGMPNAGKSTLISVISSAKPKIADYPFTTLVPNLGVVKNEYGEAYVVADIPGLIKGASEGQGLGHEFLRHVERCRFLIHVIDSSSDNPIENYITINEELKKHSEKLSQLYQIIVFNKIDVVPEEDLSELLKEFNEQFPNKDIFKISAITRQNLQELLNFVSQKVNEIEKPVSEVEIEEDLAAYDNDDSDYEVIKAAKDTYIVMGGKISRLAGITDIKNTAQIIRFQNILKSMGVFDKLNEMGIQNGDTVIAGNLEFVHQDDELFG